MSLCSSCRYFDIQFLSRVQYQWKNIPSAAVLKGEIEGCPFCCLLVASLQESSRKKMKARPSTSWVRIFFDRLGQTCGGIEAVEQNSRLGVRWLRVMLCFTLAPLDMTEGKCDVVLHVAADEGTPAATSGDVLGRYIDHPDPLSCMQLVKDWWRNCEEERESHPRCSKPLSGRGRIDPNLTPLPERCVAVTSPPHHDSEFNEASLQVKLEETQGRCGQYITLSHRWVQTNTQRSSTTKSNYHARLTGGDFGQLPFLFTQAFRAAAKFGIRYVWIDSLCIIQDDVNDWDRESMNMGQYYQLAAFTLMSTFSPEDPTLFSRYSPPTPDSIVRLPYMAKTGMQRGYFYVYPRTSRALLARKWARHINDSQLLTRGWIFQEWLLSRRIVCVTPSGVFMQCQCHDQAAAQNQYGEDVGWFPLRPECRGFLSIKASLRLYFNDIDDVYSGWETVVEHYSGLALSEPEKDRIAALSGVALEFAVALKYLAYPVTKRPTATFIAGLWTGDISRGLLWRQASYGRHKRVDGFPTWSWASINSSVRWPSRHWHLCRLNSALGDMGIVSTDNTPEWFRATPVTNIRLEAARASNKCRLRPLILISNFYRRYRPAAIDASTTTTTFIATADSNGMPHGAILDLRGRLQPVFIGDYYGQWTRDIDLYDYLDGVAVQTAPTPENQKPRAVRVPNTPSLISGWATLEHPDFQKEHLFSSSMSPTTTSNAIAATPASTNTHPIIYALLVSTQIIYKAASTAHNKKGQRPGLAAVGKHKFNVLYLRSCLTQTDLVNAYERIGVGVLFGKDAGRGFDLAVERQVQLV